MLRYDVVMELMEPMLGTVAKSKEIYSKFIESKAAERVDLPDAPLRPASELETVVDELESTGWTGFHTSPSGLIVYDYFVKGFLKNAGNVLKEDLGAFCKKKAEGGFANLKSHLNNYVFIMPRMVAITDADGKQLTQPDGVLERPLRAQTAQGPRVALAKSDYVSAWRRLAFQVVMAPGHPFKSEEELLTRLLSYAELQGFGQWRNGGYGRAKVVSFKFVGA